MAPTVGVVTATAGVGHEREVELREAIENIYEAMQG